MELKKQEHGFTLMEVLVVIAIIAILSAVAVPNFFTWLPKYRLKSAVTGLFSNMQLVKLQAVKTNQNVSITFSTGPDRYQFTILGDTRTIILNDYSSGVRFQGPAGETFTSPLTFNSRGLSNAGYAYLSNAENTGYYRVGPWSSGVIKLQKWVNGSWL